MTTIFGNQKGGAGKSTHCIMFANFLALEKNEEVLVLDLDFQESVYKLWSQSGPPGEKRPYEVVRVELEHYAAISSKLEAAGGYILIDLPGRVDDNNLIPVFQEADLFICPFRYDKLSFESTMVFAQVVRQLNPKAPLLFLPNQVKPNVRYEGKMLANERLSIFGKVIEEVPDRIGLQRINTTVLPPELLDFLKGPYTTIYEDLRFIA
ncbi:ParA family protein [Paraflavisolibacter sp. H34]|uniref:ParA family protein n=1 Tax=Huijunlia imazamoxiresistens TaxID=3127457 RepID=UPI0030195812